MKAPKPFAAEFATFPAELRKLVTAELKAGNRIRAIEHGFPAAPCGASIKLAQNVNPRRRKSGGGVSFYERNNPDYAGEFTTENRHFFVLEPPPPPQPVPDMDAIRAEREAKQRAADEALSAAQLKEQTRALKHARSTATKAGRKNDTAPAPQSPARPAQSPPPKPVTLLERFRESMVCNYERWHDGIGYNLELLKTATPEELVEIENILTSRPAEDWRDVEALAALNTPRAQVLLRKALHHSNPEISSAVARYAPGLITDAERTAMLVKALGKAEVFGGLSSTLLEVEEFHPPEVIAALWDGVQKRDGATAVHYAAMLMFLHGKAKSAFDWDLRPFFLRFNTPDAGERAAAFRELCEKIGVSHPPAP